MSLIRTALGLPNTCSDCGGLISEGYWYAEHEDAARSGLGIGPCCGDEDDIADADKAFTQAAVSAPASKPASKTRKPKKTEEPPVVPPVPPT